MELTKQHLIVGDYDDIIQYFSFVNIFEEGVSNVQGNDANYEISTHTIKSQIDEILSKDGFKSGPVFYFKRAVWKGEVTIHLAHEVIWIVRDMRFDPYIQSKMGEIFNHPTNVEFMQKK
jgi:hypothetical protein